MHLRYRQTCRVCGNPNLKDVIDLGPQYLQGSFVKEGVAKPSLRKIPTKLVRCDVTKDEEACGLVQMSVTTPPRILYSNYWYASSVSQTMRDHLAGIATEVSKVIGGFPINQTRRVLDIACNDGTLLSSYGAKPQVERYGVDPSDIARTATAKAHDAVIINDLFPSAKLDPALRFDAITSIAMFYDLEDPVDFAREIEARLQPEGVWVLELAYLPATLKQVSYDTIVGEHLGYYSLATLEHVFAKAGLRCFRAETNDINGGSIQCYVTHADCFAHDRPDWTEQLSALRMAEFDMALDTDEPYQQFSARVQTQRDDLRKLLGDIKGRGQKVHLLGASTKSMTLLQFCGLDNRVIEAASERSPAKWGAKTLGTDIPIVSEADSRAANPDYYLVGPWHFRAEIVEREKAAIAAGTRFIFPLPRLEIVGPQGAEVAA